MPTADELISKALHDRAAGVTQDALREPRMRQELVRERTGRRGFGKAPRALIASAAAAVIVLAIAVGVYGLRGDDGSRSTTAGGPASTLVGTQWRLTEVRSADSDSAIPAAYTAELAFGPDGQLDGRDGPNAIAGDYRVSGDLITLRISVSGAVGSTVTSPGQEAMKSIYVPVSSRTDSVTSTFTLTATSLTMTNKRWTLIFSPAVTSAPTHSSPSPTATLDAPASYCMRNPTTRAGTDTRMVPGSPFAVTICSAVPARPAKTVTGISQLVQALNALPTGPAPNGCVARGPGALPAVGTYELHFHYRSGPDVLISVIPQCKPSIFNPTLQADSAATVVPLIEAALK